MSWKLMIDDERDPLNVFEEIDPNPVYREAGWEIARTVEEAIALIERRGYPELISFDHDLGRNHETETNRLTGKDFANFLVERDLDVADMPDGFRFMVHSRNGPGAGNIQGLLDGYLRDRTPGVPRPKLW